MLPTFMLPRYLLLVYSQYPTSGLCTWPRESGIVPQIERV
jgi:hypothetical protein